MNEEKSYIPTLTLEPTAEAVAEAAAPAEEEVKKDIPIERPELEKLSPAEQAAVKAFAEKIDILNTEQVMNYGSNAQKNISEFSEAALNSVRTKDLGEVGGMLGDLVVGGLTKLYRRLYDEALVNPEFSGDFIAVRGACTVAFTGESDTPRQVVDLLQEEIERMRREGVDPEVFMLVKNQMYGELLGDVEAVLSLIHI